jgi:phosphoglycerate kinase
MSHLGRPKGETIPEMSLDPVAFALEDILGRDVMFSNDCISDDAVELSEQMQPGEVHLLENLRFHKGETENDSGFSWFLSRHAGIYINDAFGTAHRVHASNVGITKHIQNTAAGFLIEKEMKYLYETIQNPLSPTVLILGGAKISDKIELIKNMINKVNVIIIGGAMAFTFLKAQGKNIGASVIDEANLQTADDILLNAENSQTKIILPHDVVSAKEMSAEATWRVASLDELKIDEAGFDIGPETALNYEFILSSANTIIWNGPMGVCEIPSFSTGTQSIASIVRDRTEDGAISIIGGGDTACALKNSGIAEGFTHISTGGGASLQLLSGKELPAFEALNEYA